MSLKVMGLVWESSVPAPQRLTLLALADRADDSGQCWPSIGWLATRTRTGESTVRRHLAGLVAAEVLTVRQRYNASSVYHLDLAVIRSLTPSQSDTPPQIGTPSQSERTPPPNLSGPPSQSEHLSVIDPPIDPARAHDTAGCSKHATFRAACPGCRNTRRITELREKHA